MTEDELYDVDYDLSAALRHNSLSDKVECIAKVVVSLDDGTDETSWHWIVQLTDGKFAYVSGGHDYTGWDCQSSCDWEAAETFADAMKLAPQDERRVFEEMITKGETHRSGYAKVDE